MVVLATVGVLILVHAFRMLVLTDDKDVNFLLTFAFIPARYSADAGIAGAFPGGFAADLWTFFTYAFIHADLMHLGLNLAWLIPFGPRWRAASDRGASSSLCWSWRRSAR